jgi:hypothetical protein
MEKDGYEFKDFALQCARAFGALVTMRDEPMDAVIPDEFQPSEYRAKALAEANADVQRLGSMAAAERDAFGREQVNRRAEYARTAMEKDKRENERLDAMAAQVALWKPPSTDHEEMKSFMLQQLSVSRNDLSYHERPGETDPLKVWNDSLAAAVRGVEYHTVEMAKEKERAESRTNWVRLLKSSLGMSN